MNTTYRAVLMPSLKVVMMGASSASALAGQIEHDDSVALRAAAYQSRRRLFA